MNWKRLWCTLTNHDWYYLGFGSTSLSWVRECAYCKYVEVKAPEVFITQPWRRHYWRSLRWLRKRFGKDNKYWMYESEPIHLVNPNAVVKVIVKDEARTDSDTTKT
jgi:hypothetical protein